MTPNFLDLTEETTAAAATARIRELADIEMVFYVYVVDRENQLKGVMSLRACLKSTICRVQSSEWIASAIVNPLRTSL